MRLLDTAALPLIGLQLIEASAGTGKTHAITTLYLRLLLETSHGVRNLLVVTFTRAATDELRARIRQRLVDARALLLAPGKVGAVKDEALRVVLQRQIEGSGENAALRKLDAAIAGIDEAAIYTIHAFCQQALRDHAFESGELFDAELTDNQDDITHAAVIDWWRQRFYPDAAMTEFVASRKALQTPSAVESWLGGLLARDLDVRVPVGDIGTLKNMAGALKARWPQERASILLALDESVYLSKRRDKSRHNDLVAAVDALDAWAASDALLPPALAHQLGQRYMDEQLITDARRKNGGHAPVIPFSAALDALAEQSEALELSLLAEARAEILIRSNEQKRRANLLAYDDLINRLRAALLTESGERLAQRIAAQFPAAMIDEFQDTDPAQYDIFSRIYRDGDRTSLLMIGDPKQAIYSFRGADIFAYVRARQATPAAQRHTMGTNWRSSRNLVRGVNALFNRLPDIFLMGADVPWIDVDAAGIADEKPLRIQGDVPVPLQFFIANDDKRFNKDEFRDHAAHAAANEIARLLNEAANGQVQIGKEILQPRDIAILVRSHSEAVRMQEALRQRDIGSALASQGSVFDTGEAQDLAHVLDAMLMPANEQALKRALLTPLWGFSANTLTTLLGDDNRRDALQEQLYEWHQLWATRGFMPAFRRWLHEARIPANLLARPKGERAMTNVLQLAELLQQATRDHASPDELRRWLARNIAGDESSLGEARQLRLESDENLVQVVTMHKSKGLEYPVVFLPFAGLGALHGDVKQRDDKPIFHDEANNYRLALDYLDQAKAMPQAQRESLAEDMRLLYVALTRAEHLCCVHWGAAPGFSALALLLLGDPAGKDQRIEKARLRFNTLCLDKKSASNAQVAAVVNQQAAAHPNAMVVRAPEVAHIRYVGKKALGAQWQAARITRTLSRDWRVTSFSALASQAPDAHESSTRLPVGSASEDSTGTTAALFSSSLADNTFYPLDVSAFPRGTRAGHFFHELLENLDFPQAREKVLEEAIHQQCLRHDIAETWRDTVAKNVADVLDTPLADGLLLRNLTADRRSNECEFYYPLKNLDARHLERIVPGLAGRDAHGTRFTFSPVSGLMHGYIDLVFEHQGRWFVADWKTNWLGETPQDYGGEALQQAMRHHAYDLQYWVYTIALHRHLKQKLGVRYDYDRHVGGVYYFFLRGMRPENGMNTGVFFDKPSRDQVEALDALLFGEKQASLQGVRG